MLCLAWYWLLLLGVGIAGLGAGAALVCWFLVTQRAAGPGGWHYRA
jgi:hypothetical protein